MLALIILDGDDYVAIPSFPVELSLSDLTEESCFFLNIEDDEVAEGTETLILELGTLGETDVILSPSQLLITITDNDGGILHMQNIPHDRSVLINRHVSLTLIEIHMYA